MTLDTPLTSAASAALDRHAADRPGSVAVRDSYTTLSWADLHREVQALAHDLRTVGIGSGTPTMVLADVSVEAVVLYWALRSLDAVVIVADPRCRRAEYDTYLELTRPTHVLSCVSGAQKRLGLSGACPDDGPVWHELGERNADGRRVWRLGPESRPASESPLSEFDGAAVLVFSSGTTGTPKAIVHTRSTIAAFHETVRVTWDLGPSDVVLSALPMHTIYGLIFVASSAIDSGSQLVLLERFHPEHVLAAIEKYRVTTAAFVPTMVLMMLGLAGRERFDTSSLRVTFTGSASISDADIARFTEFTGAPLLATYGMSECPAAALERSGSTHVAGSAGQASPGFEACARAEDGTRLPPGKIGEITLRGPTLMAGYLGQPELTAKRIRDGWIHSEDLGWVDDCGHIYVTGRSSDMIIRGGLNIAPREIEDVLGSHGDVVQACVTGAPDQVYGQVVRAYVVASDPHRPGLVEDLHEHCARHLSRAKVPANIVLMRELPVNAGGKVLRRELMTAEDSLRIRPTVRNSAED